MAATPILSGNVASDSYSLPWPWRRPAPRSEPGIGPRRTARPSPPCGAPSPPSAKRETGSELFQSFQHSHHILEEKQETQRVRFPFFLSTHYDVPQVSVSVVTRPQTERRRLDSCLSGCSLIFSETFSPSSSILSP